MYYYLLNSDGTIGMFSQEKFNENCLETQENIILDYDNLYKIKSQSIKNNFVDNSIPEDCYINDFDCVDNSYSFNKTKYNARKEKYNLDILREKREVECFPIINRGKLWYDSLNELQLAELDCWYKSWLNVTITKLLPLKPLWLI